MSESVLKHYYFDTNDKQIKRLPPDFKRGIDKLPLNSKYLIQITEIVTCTIYCDEEKCVTPKKCKHLFPRDWRGLRYSHLNSKTGTNYAYSVSRCGTELNSFNIEDMEEILSNLIYDSNSGLLIYIKKLKRPVKKPLLFMYEK